MNKFTLFVLAVACCLSFSEEEDFISSIKRKSNEYFSKTNRSKLELLFSQPQYAPGDTAHFKTSYLRASDLKTVTGTEVVHVCLFDQLGKKVLTRWFTITNGLAMNDLAIPENLTPGNYVLVAFTNWMKNHDQSLFYRREFPIAGKNIFIKPDQKDTMIFYPEGGKLIAGIENSIAVRYSGSKSKISASLKAEGMVIANLNLVRDSVSTFRMTPVMNMDYRVEALEPEAKQATFPRPISSGVSVIAEASDQGMKIRVSLTEGMQNERLYLLVFNNAGLQFQNSLDFGSGRTKEFILPPSLPAGVAQLIVTDMKYNVWANRTIYVGARQTSTATLSNLAKTFSTRQTVELELQTKINSGASTNEIFTCRVINNDLFQSTEQKHDYLIFGSDISNTFELKEKNPSVILLNNYLITQSCPWLDWKKMTTIEQSPLFKPEQHLVFSGTVTYAKSGLPVRDSTLIMFFLEKSLKGYETYAHRGHFTFPLVMNVNSNDRFFYTASYKGNDTEEILVKVNDPDSLISFRASPILSSNSEAAYFTYSLLKASINKSYSFFTNHALSDSTFKPNKLIEEELNGADFTVRLSDYLQLPSMEEVLKELVRSVEYRKIHGRHVVRVYTTAKRPTNYSGPLYIIDGQVTKRPEHFLNLKPADVVIIKLIKDSRKLFPLGKIGDNGVILVETKSRTKINESSMINFTGSLSSTREDNITRLASPAPDFRSCIYWSPAARTNNGHARIKFTTSDDLGNFKIQIYGLTENGEPFFNEQPFEVKYSNN